MNINIITKVKRVSAVLLMLCFILPLSQCRGTDGVGSLELTETVSSSAEQEIFVAVEVLNEGSAFKSVAVIALFFFTLPFFILHIKVKSFMGKVIMHGTEILVTGIVAYVLMMGIIVVSRPLAAGYLTLFSIALYMLMTFAQLVYVTQNNKNSNQVDQPDN